MTLSIWRYSHLALAVSSFLFIALASITGIVLAFEPVSQRLEPHAVSGLPDISLSQTISALQKNHEEIVEIKVEKPFVTADVIDENGDSKQFYINPKTAEPIGEIQPKSEFFEWFRTLHRSLFLHGLGRIFMGVTAFLLFLIAASGSVLVIKRQRGIRHFFSKVVKDDFFSFYHVLFGRFWLLPILILTLTGMFLTVEGFNVFATEKVSHDIDFDNIKDEPKIAIRDFKVFSDIELAEVTSVEFPFSPDPEDYFTVKTKNAELVVNQITGEVLSSKQTPSVQDWKNLSLDLHTGRASAIWAIILAIAAMNILFFIWSGFAITLKRQKGKIRNRFKKQEAEIIILAGSENGSTMRFAKIFHQSLIASGQKSFMTELNAYEDFPAASQLVVFTATYGNGEAPANGTKALQKIAPVRQTNNPRFSVVAFGSHAYPDFCKFGFEVFNALSQTGLSPLLEIKTVNDKSIEAVQSFVNDFSLKTKTDLKPDWKELSRPPRKLREFTVISKTDAAIGEAFLITFDARKRGFTSGDLLNIYPALDHRERQYSIGKVAGKIQLSVKRHENGLGSEYLHNLKTGDKILGLIAKNPEFHLPEKAREIILISNGTGIAPFLGMIYENTSASVELYCGFRDSDSFKPYRISLESLKTAGKLSALHLALSREGNRQYVYDLLERDSESIGEKLKDGAVFMLCGSLAMQKDVLSVLEKASEKHGKKLADFQASGQIKMDCY